MLPSIEELQIETPGYTQSYNVTPFDWIDQTTMMPKEVEGGEKDDPFDFRIASVTLPDTSIYKGDRVVVYVTVHNYGSYYMKAFLNVKVKEDSGLYIGFDRGVWSYHGCGIDMIYFVAPGNTFTYSFAFGPVLYDDDRGIWALNGGIDSSSYVATSLWYELYQVKLLGEPLFGGYPTEFDYDCSISFYVIQKTSSPRILAAVVDDDTCWINPATFYEEVVDYPIRIGEGDNLEPYTTFEQEFNVDLKFYQVGSYDWHDSTHGQASLAEAYRNTRYALGKGLKLGGNWITENVKNTCNPSYWYCYTQRENHGFDIGLGLLPAGYTSHTGNGVSLMTGSVAVTMGSEFYSERVKECALHELCHLFGALHGDQYGLDSFGFDEDGYTYVMADGTGEDLSPDQGWRMHTLTRQKINGNNHLKKFDGAPAPEYYAGNWYGQIECYVQMNANHYSEPVYRLDSDGLYHWGYNSQDYRRFSVTDDFVLGVEEIGTVLSTKYVDADVSLLGYWKTEFYAAYKLYWSSNHWPTGFNPSQGIKLEVDFWSWENCDDTISTVDNVKIQVISDRSSTPSVLYTVFFEANSPSDDWKKCHDCWAMQTCMRDIDLTDSEVYLLFGFRDAWDRDYHQELKIHPGYIKFKYTWSDW